MTQGQTVVFNDRAGRLSIHPKLQHEDATGLLQLLGYLVRFGLVFDFDIITIFVGTRQAIVGVETIVTTNARTNNVKE